MFCAAGRSLEGFIPKSAKDFEEFGRLVAGVHMLPHARSSHYKVSPATCCYEFGWVLGKTPAGGCAPAAARQELALQGKLGA